jgi:hypothetical protein
VTPVRTAFHDAVARFGGFGMASVERFLLAERPWTAPPLTSLSHYE